MDGASLYGSPTDLLDGYKYYPEQPEKKCKRGYRRHKTRKDFCVKKIQETMYPTVFTSLGYKKPSKTRKSTTTRISPKTRKASPKMITILRPDGEVLKLPSTIKTIIGAKRKIQQKYGIPVLEQNIFSENSERPLENTTDKLEELGTLVLFQSAPPPPEFSNLDNTTTGNKTINLRRITMKILLDHIDDEGLTFIQLFDKVVEYNEPDMDTVFSLTNTSVAAHQRSRKRLFTAVLEPFMQKGFIKMEFDETLFPASLNAPLWELRLRQGRLTMRQMLNPFFGSGAVLRPAILNVIRVTLNRDDPYIATLV